MKIENLKLTALAPYARNARLHSADQVAAIAASIREFGFTNPVLVDADGNIIAGHGRVLAAQRIALASVPCVRLAHLTPAQVEAYRIADNRLAETGGGWDDELLRVELADLAQRLNFDTSLLGFTPDEIAALSEAAERLEREKSGVIAERFLYPPFSVLDARCGWWQQRKSRWIDLGINSAEGRESGLLYGKGICAKAVSVRGATTTTSIFDPVLAELVYRWFCPAQGTVLDPFAGGSVRGIVADELGLAYTGFDVRAEQCDANRAQYYRLHPEKSPTDEKDSDTRPVWYAEDIRTANNFSMLPPEFDLLFTCPPYGDLEKYSDQPGDISNLPADAFLREYREIIAHSCALLAPDRFAAIVVGDYRAPDGYLRNFVSDTIAAFAAAGFRLYNEAILVTQVGSLPLRVAKQFINSRKFGKTHQNLLVFCNGDPVKAARACGTICIDELADRYPNTPADEADAIITHATDATHAQ